MLDKLFQLITLRTPLSDDDKKLCLQYFEPINYPKNTIIEEHGNKPEYLYFIGEGFMRLFYYDDEGEKITSLNISQWFHYSIFGFYSPKTNN